MLRYTPLVPDVHPADPRRPRRRRGRDLVHLGHLRHGGRDAADRLPADDAAGAGRHGVPWRDPDRGQRLALVAVAPSHQLAGRAGVRPGLGLLAAGLLLVRLRAAQVGGADGDRPDAVRRPRPCRASIAPNIERRGQAFLAGAIGGALQLVAGVTGPILDIFYVRTGMTRQVNVSTKSAAQVMGHLTKVTYFGALVANPAGRDSQQWLVMAFAAVLRGARHDPVARRPRPAVGQAVLLLDAAGHPGDRRGLHCTGRLADGGKMSETERQGPGAGAARPAARRLRASPTSSARSPC